MDKLIKIKRPEKGEDFGFLWRHVNDLIDAINDLPFTIKPADYGRARIEEGDIQLQFDPAKIAAGLKALRDGGGSNPPAGKPDNPGGSPGSPDYPGGDGGNPTNSGNPGCSAQDFATFGALCASIVILRSHQAFSVPDNTFCDFSLDQAAIYDSRAGHNLIANYNSNLLINDLGGPSVGHTTMKYGIIWGLGAYDVVHLNAPPGSCYGVIAPPAANHTLYQEDYDSNGYKKPTSPPP